MGETRVAVNRAGCNSRPSLIPRAQQFSPGITVSQTGSLPDTNCFYDVVRYTEKVVKNAPPHRQQAEGSSASNQERVVQLK